MNVSPRELEHAIDGKVKPERRPGGKEINYWYCLDDVQLFRITKPNVHGMASVPPGTLYSVRQQLKLSSPDFRDLIKCPMSGSEYKALIRQKVKDGTL